MLRTWSVIFGLLAIVFLPISHCSAQTARRIPVEFSEKVLPALSHPGEVAEIVITAKIDPGWHLYSINPVPPPGPSATVITPAGTAFPKSGPVRESKPETQNDPNFGKAVQFHEHTAVFTVPVKISRRSYGSVVEPVSIRYQACNAQFCLPPATVVLSVPISVIAGSVRQQYSSDRVSPSEPGGLFLFLAGAFAAGLLSLITPCVFPLIPISIASFVKQANGDRRKLLQLATGYSLGIIVLYAAIGVVTALVIGATGISRLATNPWVNLIAFVIFVVFALSFFETIRIGIPGNLGSLQIAARKQGGLIGLVTLGTLFVLASFTCTAPFIGTLLVAAAGGSLFRPLLGMLVFSIAFTSPFLLLASFPTWISSLPKGGIWLTRIKASLGFIELAAALKFLSNADLVWQWRLLTAPVMMSLWLIIFVSAGLYLLDIWRFGATADDSTGKPKVTGARAAFAGVFFLAAGYAGWGLTGRPLLPIVAAYLPPAGYGWESELTLPGGPWMSDYSGALAQGRTQVKPILIDFTGYTCTNCRLNERNVFPNQAVLAELSKFVLVQLYTDGGVNATRNENLELHKFGDVALPLYGIVDPTTGTVLAKTAGVQTPASFAAFLHSADSINNPNSGQWQSYSVPALVKSTDSGRPVIIDFTASWCTNCRAIERTVFPDQRVAQVLKNFDTYRADMTDFYSPSNAQLENRYQVNALPAIVFLDTHGKEVPGTRVTGLLTPAQFLDHIHKASSR